jgi:Flp pilus assembly protein TadG
MQSILRRRARRRGGAISAETALGLPLFFLLVFSAVEMTRLGQTYSLLALAAREGCRVAVIPGNVQTDGEAVVRQILNAGGITSYNTPQWTWGNGKANLAGTSLGDPVTLTLSVPFGNVSWLATSMFLGSATLQASATHCSEFPG